MQGDTWAVSAPFNWVNAIFNQTTEDYGITPSFSYEAVFLGNITGGQSRAVAYAHSIEFGLSFDLNKIADIPGASIVLSGANGAGRNLSGPQYINNTFGVAETFIGQGTYLYQFYWQQSFAEDRIVFQVGRLNGSSFASLPAFGLQVSGGINGNPASLSLNTSFEGMPNGVWGGQVTVSPDEEYYVSAGLFQATPYAGNQHGTDFSFRSSDRLLLLGEVGWTPTFGHTDAKDKATKGYSGTYLAGFYYSNLPRARFDGNGDINHTAGLYLMGQQTVWRNASNPSEMIDVWAGMTYSPQGKVAQMEFMGFSGITWQGLIPGRDQDQLLATVLIGTFSSEYGDSVVAANPQDGRPTYETALELSYIYKLNSYAFIQPDIQYIIRPNGMKSTQDALVLGIQFGVNF